MSQSLMRFCLSLPFVLGVMVVAFGLGTYLGGKFLVPPGQGLAAPAEAMGYGLLLTLIAMAVAIFAAVKMPMRLLGLSALVGIVVSVLCVGGLTLAMKKAEADREAYIRDLETRQVTATVAEPPCPMPDDGTTTDEQAPCQDD